MSTLYNPFFLTSHFEGDWNQKLNRLVKPIIQLNDKKCRFDTDLRCSALFFSHSLLSHIHKSCTPLSLRIKLYSNFIEGDNINNNNINHSGHISVVNILYLKTIPLPSSPLGFLEYEMLKVLNFNCKCCCLT